MADHIIFTISLVSIGILLVGGVIYIIYSDRVKKLNRESQRRR